MVLVDGKTRLYMVSQPQEDAFNIDACWECDKIRLSHIETGAEKLSNSKTELASFAIL